ncbi:MAG TPA: tRNA uridine-5-carboxymethylaminomethyl(34) synthesis GTPase MnmE, partial [Hyphomonadaceae bacterium]|nr:tRNA uridine-5-carboxymethylaminomethyl(34) synthesis GTPase MnmE [Hyphomonadaceae bacterium]
MRAEDETIFALATAPGRGAVAVMRVSGRRALAALIALAGRAPPARRAALRSLRDPISGDPID